MTGGEIRADLLPSVLLGLVPEGAEAADLWWYPLSDVRADGLAPTLLDGARSDEAFLHTLRRIVRFRLRPDDVVMTAPGEPNGSSTFATSMMPLDRVLARGRARSAAGTFVEVGRRESWQAATPLRIAGSDCLPPSPCAPTAPAGGILLRGHVAGNGSIAHLTRLLAIALDRADPGPPVWVEDLVDKPLADNRTMSPVQRADTARILAREPSPSDRIAASIRCTYRLPEEALLRGRAFDWPERNDAVQCIWAGVSYSEIDGRADTVREMIAAFDRWLAVSHHSRNALIAGGVPGEKVDVLPHPIDERLFHPDLEPRDPERPFTVLNVSVAYPKLKGVDVLLRGFALAFASDRTGSVLRIHQRKGGLGELAAADPEVRRALDQLGDRVILTTGPLTQDGLARLYGEADCYVQASRAEASGLTALEAACRGTPALVTGWGGPADYTDGEAVRPIACRLDEAEPYPLAWESRGAWAHPDPRHLAELLLETRNAADEWKQRARAAAPALIARFGLEAVGRRAVELLG